MPELAAHGSRTSRIAGHRVLIVEDNAALRRGIGIALRECGAEVHEEADGAAACRRLDAAPAGFFDVVVTDLRLPGADGLQVLRAARARDGATAVLVMTAYGSIDTAVEAMRLGALDFLQKPFELAQLEQRVARACEEAEVFPAPGVAVAPAAGVVAESAAMREAIALACRVAGSRSTVLVTGETGTGKEVIAELIHAASDRRAARLVKVNCAALPETLLESELFGHERGAFTGADRRRRGRFEEATGGTLFLDEIGDVALPTQAKLLRVLQEQAFYRLGGTEELRTDARIVAATNRDLAAAKRSGEFREDLYFRLDVIGIHLPPLRERPEDLLALSERLLQEFARELDRPALGFAPEALARIRAYPWPGNVRELRNVIERAVLTAAGDEVEAGDLGLGAGWSEPGRAEWRPHLPPEGVDLRDVERWLVMAALERTGHVQKDAAALLHISRRKLNYMIQRMGLTHPSWRRNRDAAS